MVTMGGVKDKAKEECVVSVPFPQVEGKHSQIQSGKLPQEINESHWMWDKRKKRSKETHEVGVEKKATKPKASNVVIKDLRKLEWSHSTNNPITMENYHTLKLHNNKPHNNKEMEAYLVEETSKWK
ncbi:hypothetical protein PIB30_094388 [Stylosanthes scabra]|uniref:Uncharacterized protein n=1 Tax=Stylosanthes scabra TaxID=79078 RepID=A0ABU6ZUQ2_9FABA|nr:hypothetical protein [Stylosanthes scabra]